MNDINIPSSFPPPGSPLPDLPPLPVVEEATAVPLQPVSAPKQKEAKDLLIRANCSGDKVFLLDKGVRRWISSAEKLKEIGYTFADVTRISDEQLLFYQEGDPI